MDGISNDEAENLLKRALKHLSTKYKTKTDIKLCKMFNEEVCLEYCGTDVLVISLDKGLEVNFTSILHLLNALLTAKTLLKVSNFDMSNFNDKFSSDTCWIDIDFSKEFGTSIEELKIKLDLLSA